MFVSEITEQGNWLVFPKTISKHIGLVKTLLLMEHVNISDTKGGDNGWYYRTRSSLAEVLGMSDHSCKKHEDELVQQDLLKRKTSTNGVHANYYKLNKRKIKELLATASNTEGGKKVSPINNTSIDNTTYYQDTKKPESASNRNVAMKAPVVSGSSPKSSTVQKRDMLLPQRSKFKALSKDGNPRDAKKRAEIMLQPETMELLEFWNSLPYIQKHKIAYDGDKLVQLSKQSKSLQHIDKVLQEVLKGSLYKDCADISEDRYKIYKPQMPAIKMALKRYSESLNPDCNYAVKGFKIPLYKFFVFRQMSVDPALGKAKYKRKYPFLYYLSCEAKPLEQERKELSTNNQYSLLGYSMS